MRLIDADELKTHKFLTPQVKVIGGRRCGKTREQIIDAYQKGWNDAIDAIIDNAPTVETEIEVVAKDAYEHGYADGWKERFGEPNERPQCEWIKGQEISRMMIANEVQHIEYKDYTCSNCGLVLDNLLYHYDGSPFYKFCPECGARMSS